VNLQIARFELLTSVFSLHLPNCWNALRPAFECPSSDSSRSSLFLLLLCITARSRGAQLALAQLTYSDLVLYMDVYGCTLGFIVSVAMYPLPIHSATSQTCASSRIGRGELEGMFALSAGAQYRSSIAHKQSKAKVTITMYKRNEIRLCNQTNYQAVRRSARRFACAN